MVSDEIGSGVQLCWTKVIFCGTAIHPINTAI